MGVSFNDGCPTFTIVVPVRNGAATIGPCVESLLAQRYAADRYEIVIVDNGSTDATADVVAAYPVTLLPCLRPGPSPARNAGWRNSEAEIIAFTDADCVADPGWLSGLAAAFADDSVGAAGGAIEAFRHPQRTFVELFCDDMRPLGNYRTGEGEFLPFLMGANAAYRRAALLNAGGWDDGLGTAEDIELAWRVQLKTRLKIAYCPDAIVYHRHRSTWKSLARQYWVYGLGEVLLDSMFRAHTGYPRNPRFYRQRLARQIAALLRYGASGAIRALRRMSGRATAYEAAFPWLLLVAEGANVAAKLKGLALSRGLRDPEPLRRYLEVAIPSHYLPQSARTKLA
jgi:cellulose synthase/poly-beta-1,6-N-acetylglucosamine synthase-like glycosyltransferase